ncbi:hypothetical protein ACXYTJ_13710 [Gilvimarinus sp. F26214L]|uniref:hypothetical protein n=1 Tax=Gilvimarinus sp. DZF01 TaxID=3461371 RepID=UPI0040454AE6
MKDNALVFASTILLSLGLVLVVYAAIPGLAIPTLGQAVWSTGFSQSFINGSLSIYADNIGAPEPAPIAFGLSGAIVAALFMKLGAAAADAYAGMVAFWSMISFFGSYFVARHFQAPRWHSLVAALAWMLLPITWAHASYSMLSIGIGLLPFYFLFTLKVFADEPVEKARVGWYALYPLICSISVFMDGYSFIFFAAGSSLFVGWTWVSSDGKYRAHTLRRSLPIHVASFAFAYMLYASYIGKVAFAPAPLDFFRGWGLDLSFFVLPTKGILLVPDLFGFSVARSPTVLFGDASVWNTTFLLPLAIAAVAAAKTIRKRKTVVVGLAVISVFGFYMALGPSLKINSEKPPEQESPMMKADQAIAPTGSAVLSSRLPGFNNMRASYRWMALCSLGLWMLLVLALGYGERRISVALLLFVALLSLPDPVTQLKKGISNRKMFFDIEAELVESLKTLVSPGELVAFLPWRNDFLVNYWASRLDVVTYNIGGDKNLAKARAHWPTYMRQFPMSSVDAKFSERIVALLAAGEAESVVLPYIDTLSGAHAWPGSTQFRRVLGPAIEELELSGHVQIAKRQFYAVVRLKPELSALEPEIRLRRIASTFCLPPYCLDIPAITRQSSSQVGVWADGTLNSSGAAGFLHFGPYVHMRAGAYRLIVDGEIGSSSASWLDLASSSGTVQHARFELSPQKSERIVESTIHLPVDVLDLEIRLFVGPSDEVVLRGYKLVPVAEADGA